ncbi:MAG: BON domain-containing protein [Deltaproteobacteria bacterium]|nr:BON domain-containing protein [Deltaproteobacteria bacterium]
MINLVRSSLSTSLALLALMIGATSYAAAWEPEPEVEALVARRIDDAQLGRHGILIDSYEGKVTLNGTVSSETDKARIESIVLTTPGVREVENDLRVAPGIPDRYMIQDSRAQPKIFLDLEPGDQLITQDVNTFLRRSGVPGASRLRVATTQGVVSLKGNLQNAAQVEKILSGVAAIDGVRDINSQITLYGTPPVKPR